MSNLLFDSAFRDLLLAMSRVLRSVRCSTPSSFSSPLWLTYLQKDPLGSLGFNSPNIAQRHALP